MATHEIVFPPAVTFGVPLGGVPHWSMLWQRGRVPYCVSRTLIEQCPNIGIIYNAIDVFNEQIESLKWTQRCENDEDYVEFQYGDRCWSHVGRRGGKQDIVLASGAKVGNILHEMGHAIGLGHEHSRDDRNFHIDVQMDVVQDNEVHNFEKNGIPLGPYDFDSIMHYRLCDSSKNGEATIVSRALAEARRIDQEKDRFSKLDVKAIESLYGPEMCTHERYGNTPWQQRWYECVECWGPESDLGCCHFCAFYHHSGPDHLLRSHAPTQFVCACGQNDHQKEVCTWHATKCDKIKQPLYRCVECSATLCYQCIRKCHAGHQIQCGDQGYCECRRKGQCTIPNPSCDDSCTYDTVGRTCQAGYECQTCWGGESDYGCCLYCAFNCHKGHFLVYHPEESTATSCDCGHNEHSRWVCTRHSSDKERRKQPFFSCSNCFSGNNEGCCYQCMKTCHAGHNTSYMGITEAFCDCGLECCQKSCIIPRPLHKINIESLIHHIEHYVQIGRAEILVLLVNVLTHFPQINVFAYIEDNSMLIDT